MKTNLERGEDGCGGSKELREMVVWIRWQWQGWRDTSLQEGYLGGGVVRLDELDMRDEGGGRVREGPV